MVKTLKHRIRYYRKFRNDIWGLCKLSYQLTDLKKYKRVTRFFYKLHLERREWRRRTFSRYAYRIDIINPAKRRRFIKKRFLNLRLVKFFYLTLTYKQFHKMAVESRKKDGYFEGHYCLALEGRLISFLYRTSFVSNMFESLYYIKNSFVTLNRRIFNYVNQPTKLYMLLSFHPIIKKKIYLDLLTRLCINKRFLFNSPKYMYVSYCFLFAFMFRYPAKNDLVLPKFLDIYRATGFAQ